MSGIEHPDRSAKAPDAEGQRELVLDRDFYVGALKRAFEDASYTAPQIEDVTVHDAEISELGATLQLHRGPRMVHEFGVFADPCTVDSLARDAFRLGYDQAFDKNFLLDTLAETLNLFMGRVKGFLLEDAGIQCRLNTPSPRPDLAGRVFLSGHRNDVVLRITNDAWEGPLFFVASSLQDPVVLALQEAIAGLAMANDETDALFWVQRRLNESCELLASLGGLPSNRRALEWCTSSVKRLSKGMDPDSALALRGELNKELVHLQESLRRTSAPSSETSFVLSDDEDSIELLEEYCEDTRELLKTARQALQDASNQSINAILRSIHTIKGGAGFMGLEQVEELAHITEDLLTKARDAGVHLRGDEHVAVDRSVDLIAGWLGSLEQTIQEGAPIPFNPCMEEHRRAIEHGLTTHCSIISKLDDSIPCDKSASPSASIKVAAEHITELQSIDTSLCSLLQRVAPELDRSPWAPDLAEAECLCDRLTRTVRAMNTVSLRSLFSKIARLARDTADRESKAVRVDTSGEMLKVPRHLVSILSGPLVHIVRNAVDHGLESPEERMACDKEFVARIELTAYWKQDYLVFEVRDDGRGIRAEDILAKARTLGLIDPHAQLEETEIFSLMMEPGFSTKEETTELSGRGVGLDVVKRNIESSGGLIDVSSTVGSGSLFRIALPMDPSLRVPKDLFEATPPPRALEVLSSEPEEVELAVAGEVMFF